jgi:hypothetical protein
VDISGPRQGYAHLGHDELDQFRSRSIDKLAQPGQRRRPLVDRESRPAVESVPGGLDGAVNIGRRAAWHLADLFLGGGIYDLARAGRRARYKLTADVDISASMRLGPF